MPRARTILLEAYEKIKDPDKWNGTGQYQHGSGKRCIVEAIFDACVARSAHSDVSVRPATRRIRAAIRQTAHVPKRAINYRGGINIINWNDSPETTHDDVMAVFKRAIKAASWPWERIPA